VNALPPPATRTALVLVLGIVALAGFVDACSFVRFGGVFVSFMSGNTTSLGVALATGQAALALRLGLVLTLFVAGVVLGTLLHQRLGPRWAAPGLLALVAALLLAPQQWPALGIECLTLAMGVLNASVHQVGNVAVGLTYFTGALVKFGTGLAQRLRGQPATGPWRGQLGLWAGFLGGAVLGGVVLARLPQLALPVAAGFGAVLAGLALLAPGLR